MRSKTGRSLKKFLSLLLTLSMVLGMLPVTALAEDASAEPISYLTYTWDDVTKSLKSTSTELTGKYTVVEKAADFLADRSGDKWSGGVYYVSEDVTIDADPTNPSPSGTVHFEGDVTLIIAPGKTLTINGNVQNETNSITIYGQASEGGAKGKFVINHESTSLAAMKGGYSV